HESVAAELASLSNDAISDRFDSGQPLAPQSPLASLRSLWFLITKNVPAAMPAMPTPTPIHPPTCRPVLGLGAGSGGTSAGRVGVAAATGSDAAEALRSRVAVSRAPSEMLRLTGSAVAEAECASSVCDPGLTGLAIPMRAEG